MKEVTNLLWTGGWDSTFRLLDLVLIHKKKVQPYYIISGSRNSSNLEIRQMDKIRALAYQKDTTAMQLLLPTVYVNESEVKKNEVISAQFAALKATRFLGTQYEFLARFADESGVSALELSVHKDDQAQRFLAPYVIKENGTFRLRDDHNVPGLDLFKNFRFPILELTKTSMQAEAKKKEFLGMMNETVFCHNPMPNGKPCGYCNPCRYTMEEGMVRRMRFKTQVKYYLKKIVKPFSKA